MPSGEPPADRYDRSQSLDEPTVYLPRVVAEGDGSVPWWRRRWVIAVAVSFLAVVLIGAGVFLVLRPDPPTQMVSPTLGASGSATASATPSASPSPSPSPSPSHSPSPSPTPTQSVTRRQAVVPVPTEKPPPAELPPPPPPSVPDSPDCTQWDPDRDAPHDVVRAALAEAGERQYWPGVSPPMGWPGGPYPVITVPVAMMNAIAWTESSWRSTVIACDHGIGLMQVMPDTAAWMNQRFGRSYDVHTVEGNAALGAMYLQWLIMYFGLYYFGSFDLDVVEPVGDGGVPLRLRDVVIAAYNVGYEAVENLNGTPDDGSDDTLSIPNQWYVNRVLDYMASCPCDAL